MRALIIGAGALGGHIGGDLLRARRDVMFLVRPLRAQDCHMTVVGGRERPGEFGVYAHIDYNADLVE